MARDFTVTPSRVSRYSVGSRNEESDPRTNTGAAIPSTWSCVPRETSTPSIIAPAISTIAVSGRCLAGHTLHLTSSTPSAADARAGSGAFVATAGSGRATARLHVLPREDELARRARLVESPHRSLRRRLAEPLRILLRLAVDLEERIREAVERGLRLGLGRLDHERLVDDEREIGRRRVHAEIEEPLRDVERANAARLLAIRREDELVHAEPLVRGLVCLEQSRLQIVGVQDRLAAQLRDPGPAQGAHVRERAHQDSEIPVERV